MIFPITPNRSIEINALLWDHDGTIFDTQKYHGLVESKLLKEYGIDISPEEINKKFSGVKTEKFFKGFFQQHHVNADINEVLQRKWEMMIDIVNTRGLNFMPGADWLIKGAKVFGIKQVIGSASKRQFIDYCLNKKGIANLFDGIISGDDVTNCKPDPETWYKCAKLIKIPNFECLVLEDGYNGIKAARQAEMYSLAIVPFKNYRSMLDIYNQYQADYYTNDFRQVPFFQNQFKNAFA